MKHQIPWLFWSMLWFPVLKGSVTKTIYRYMVKFTGQEYGCFCVRSQATHLTSPVVIFPIWKQVLNNESLSSLPALQVWLYSSYQYSRLNNKHMVPLVRLAAGPVLSSWKCHAYSPGRGKHMGHNESLIQSGNPECQPCQTLCSACTTEKSRGC